MKMKRTAIFIPQGQRERLELLSESTGAVMSELIRRGLEEYLEKRAPEIAEARKARKAKSK